MVVHSAAMVLLLAPACLAWQCHTGKARQHAWPQVGREALQACAVVQTRWPAARMSLDEARASTDGGGGSEPIISSAAMGSPPAVEAAPEEVIVDVAAREAVDAIVQEELATLVAQTPEEQEAQLPTLLARVEARVADAGEAQGYRFGDISRAVAESTRGEVRACGMWIWMWMWHVHVVLWHVARGMWMWMWHVACGIVACGMGHVTCACGMSCIMPASGALVRGISTRPCSRQVRRQMDSDWDMNDISLLLKV